MGTHVDEVRHRTVTPRSFGNLPIHAAPGTHEYATKLVQEHVSLTSRVLEVGAGAGALGARLASLGYDVTAAEANPPNTHFLPMEVWDVVDGSPHELPQQDYDAVVAIECIEHFENPRKALRNLAAVLRPGGILIVSTPNVLHPHSRLKFWLRGTFFLFDEVNYYHTGHWTPLPEWLLRLHIKEAGFSDIVAVRTAASFEYSHGRQLAWLAEKFFLRLVRPRFRANSGDGACLFVVARS